MEAFDLSAVSYQVVLTKTDKLRSQRDVEQVLAETSRKIAKRPAAFPRVAATSAEKGTGIPELRAEILAACSA
jgi:GTP-binding protein